jgi:Sulfotransferase family
MRSTPHILVVNGVKIRRPVFIVGAPHSGTDLLAYALKRADGVHVTMGRPEVMRVTYAFARRPSMITDRGPGAARVLRDAYAAAWQITPRACAECSLECRELSGLLESGACVQQEGVHRFGDATPDLLYSADALLDAFPDAQLLQVIRDGRDAVAQMIDDPNCLAWFRPGVANLDEVFPNPFLGVEDDHERSRWPRAGPTVKCALRWRGSVRLSAKLRAQTPHEQLLTVRFEDVLADPDRAAAELSDYLGHDISAGAFARVSPGGGEPGKGRSRLSAKQIGVVERIAGRELRRLGYLQD